MKKAFSMKQIKKMAEIKLMKSKNGKKTNN